jgi:N utilization substance protein A
VSKEIPLKAIIGTVSNEKGISENLIIEALESALVSATKKEHGADIDVRVDIDRKTGKYLTYRRWEVMEDPPAFTPLESPITQITLSAARIDNPEIQAGEFIEEEIESVDISRIGAQTAKQVIIQKVRQAERLLVAKEFTNKVHELITGIVKKHTKDGIIVDLGGNAEGILAREDVLPKETFRPGDRVKAYLVKVSPDAKGPQMQLSRTHKGMLIGLLKIEVPEIGEGIIEIKSAARDPGIRAKVAVKTNDNRIDPIGASVGMRGARVQAVSNELGGERLDIILWDEDLAQFIMNAMSPVEVASIIIDEETRMVEVAVKDEHLSQAIGKGGQNARLAAELTGWQLNIMGKTEASSRTANEEDQIKLAFIEKLQVDEDLAQLLIEEGFTSVEEIAYVPVHELLEVEEFDEEIVNLLRTRAKNALLTEAIAKQGIKEPAKDLLEVDGMTESLAQKLAQKDILTRDDLAELAIDDLLEISPMDTDCASKLIMAARAHWFN